MIEETAFHLIAHTTATHSFWSNSLHDHFLILRVTLPFQVRKSIVHIPACLALAHGSSGLR